MLRKKEIWQQIMGLIEHTKNLAGRLDTFETQINTLKAQVHCGTTGHTMHYDRMDALRSMWAVKGVMKTFTFMCDSCGYSQTKYETQLTFAEKEALVALNVLSEECLKKKGKK